MASRLKLKETIFTAAQDTYRDMWGYMRPKLKTALETQEVAYFNAVAKEANLTADMTAADMDKPFKAIVAATGSEMGAAMGGAKPPP